MAVIAGDVAKVKALLSAGADPNAEVSFTAPNWNRGEEWNTRVLVAAIVYRFPKVVDLLLRHKVSFDMYHNAFAICPAVNSRQPQIVAALIKAGIEVNPNFTCIRGLTPLESAKRRRNPEIVKLLVEAGAMAKRKCTTHTLSAGNDSVAAPGVLFSIKNIGPKSAMIVIDDGEIMTLDAGKGTTFIGDKRFDYYVKLTAPGDTTTIEICQ